MNPRNQDELQPKHENNTETIYEQTITKPQEAIDFELTT